MEVAAAQQEMRTRYRGGFYGGLVSGTLWLVSAALATWVSPKAGIVAVVFGGPLIYPLMELAVRLTGPRGEISKSNELNGLGMQVAFVLPLSMPLLAPVALYRLNLFFPALTILVGAHYLPFVFLYGMKAFVVLAGALLASGMAIALYAPQSFTLSAWVTAAILFAFALAGRTIADREYRAARVGDRPAR